MAHLRAQDHDGLLEGFQDRERRRPTAIYGGVMSWSKSFSDKQSFEDENQRKAGRDEAIAVNGPDTGAQYDAAVKAAYDIIYCGAVGDPSTRDFSVTLSGHSNPRHEPAQGWGNDCVSISIYQKAAVAAAV